MPRRLLAAIAAALVSLPLLATAAPAGALGAAPSMPTGLLAPTALGPTYQALALKKAPLNCATIAKGAAGYACAQEMWRLRAPAVHARLRSQALVVYELVVQTPGALVAESMERALGQAPWRVGPYRPIYARTWQLGFQVASKALGGHYSDWFWFRRGGYLIMTVFVIVPNQVTEAYDQSIRDQAALAVDPRALGESRVLGSPVRPTGAVLLDSADLGSVYQAVPESQPLGDCATITASASGYTCTEGVWQMSAANVGAEADQEAVAIYELVVQTPSMADAQALNSAIVQGGNAPWTMPQYVPVGDAMWQLAGQVEPGISALSSATGDWWQAVRGNDFVILDFVINETPATDAFDQVMSDQATAILSEQALASLAVPGQSKA